MRCPSISSTNSCTRLPPVHSVFRRSLYRHVREILSQNRTLTLYCVVRVSATSAAGDIGRVILVSSSSRPFNLALQLLVEFLDVGHNSVACAFLADEPFIKLTYELPFTCSLYGRGDRGGKAQGWIVQKTVVLQP